METMETKNNQQRNAEKGNRRRNTSRKIKGRESNKKEINKRENTKKRLHQNTMFQCSLYYTLFVWLLQMLNHERNALEHLFGINAFFVQFSEFSNHFGAIFLVSHAEPLAGGVENFASGSVLVDEFINH